MAVLVSQYLISQWTERAAPRDYDPIAGDRIFLFYAKYAKYRKFATFLESQDVEKCDEATI